MTKKVRSDLDFVENGEWLLKKRACEVLCVCWGFFSGFSVVSMYHTVHGHHWPRHSHPFLLTTAVLSIFCLDWDKVPLRAERLRFHFLLLQKSCGVVLVPTCKPKLFSCFFLREHDFQTTSVFFNAIPVWSLAYNMVFTAHKSASSPGFDFSVWMLPKQEAHKASALTEVFTPAADHFINLC